MAARLRPQNQQEAREKIRTTQLVKRLESHVLDGLAMEKSQVAAALGLLKKTLPDLSTTEHSGTLGVGLTINVKLD